VSAWGYIGVEESNLLYRKPEKSFLKELPTFVIPNNLQLNGKFNIDGQTRL